MSIKVGDTLYRFDENCRVYPEDAKGRRTGSPIYSKHFNGYAITGETPKSWLIDVYGRQVKVSKSELREAGRNGYGATLWYTAEGMADKIWMHDHGYKLAEYVRYKCTVDQLREIAKLIGYSEGGGE